MRGGILDVSGSNAQRTRYEREKSKVKTRTLQPNGAAPPVHPPRLSLGHPPSRRVQLRSATLPVTGLFSSTPVGFSQREHGIGGRGVVHEERGAWREVMFHVLV